MVFSSRPITAFLLSLLFMSGLSAQSSFQKIYDDGQGQGGHFLLPLADSSYIVAGFVEAQSSQLPARPWLMKVNASGDVLWQKMYPTPVSGGFRFVIAAEDGGYLAVGTLNGATHDNLLVKTDADGNFQWSRVYSGSSICQSVKKAPGGYILAGELHAFTIGTVDGYLFKIDQSGEFVWSRQYGRSGQGMIFQDLIVTEDTVYVVGIIQQHRAFITVDQESGELFSARNYPDSTIGSNLLSLVALPDGSFAASGLTTLPGTANQTMVTWQKISREGVMTDARLLYLPNVSMEVKHTLRTQDGGFVLDGFRRIGMTNSWRSVLVKLDAASEVEAAFQYARIAPNYNHTVEMPDGSLLSVRTADPQDRMILTKTRANLQLDSCCTTPLNILVSPLPTASVEVPMMALPFGQQLLSLTLATVPRTTTVANYCPAEPVLLEQLVSFCSGDSVLVAGNWYDQAGTVVDTVFNAGGCDTITTYTLQVMLQPVRFQTIEFCPGDSVFLPSGIYTEPSTFTDVLVVPGACDTVVTYTLQWYAETLQSQLIEFCPGSSVTMGGLAYTQPGIVADTIVVDNACDTIVIYTLQWISPPTQTALLEFCAGDSVTIGGVVYTQPGTVVDTILSGGACDTIVTYTLLWLPLPTQTALIEFCPGDVVTIGGVVYSQPGTVVDTIVIAGACDTIVTYTLQWLPLPTQTALIEFCPGDSVTIGGVVYTQPDTIVTTLPAALGCDTIATYVLAFTTLPQPSALSLQCPDDVTVSAATGATSAVVTYASPVGETDCPCGETSLELLQGLPSNNNFPLGATQVCHQATDDCGSTASCCFTVTVEASAEEEPCDVKTTPCVRFEILAIFQNPAGQKTYRLRVTNTCTSPLVYVAFQLPDGLTADAPANNTSYTTPGGRTYTVRNANASPFHAIRFKTDGAGLASGQSDVFEYTLPPQAAPLFIHAAARLESQAYYETHLNVFGCVVQPISSRPQEEVTTRAGLPGFTGQALTVFPNPFADQLNLAFEPAAPGQVQLVLTDLMGQVIFSQPEDLTSPGTHHITWNTENLPAGAYWVGLHQAGLGWTYRKVMLVR